MSDGPVYDRRTVLYHWLTAGIVVAMWLLAETIDDFPRPLQVYPRSTHIVLGLALLVLFVMRIVWRSTQGRRLPSADRGLMHVAAKATHYALYLLVGVTLALGVSYEAVRADLIFGLFRLPSVAPGDQALRRFLAGWHGTAANAVLIVAGVHAAAALFHQYVLKDHLLRRMRVESPISLPAGRSSSSRG